MFSALKNLNGCLVDIAEKVKQNTEVTVKAVESIKRSNGQIPAAVQNLPYKRHKIA